MPPISGLPAGKTYECTAPVMRALEIANELGAPSGVSNICQGNGHRGCVLAVPSNGRSKAPLVDEAADLAAGELVVAREPTSVALQERVVGHVALLRHS